MLERPLPAQLVGFDHQRDYHSTELQTKHQELRDAYRKLVQIEYKLANRSTLGIQRKEKKKLQWARATVKRKVQDLEHQSAGMREQVFASRNVMIETGPPTAMSLASYPFTPSPYGMPMTPLWPLQSPCWPVPGVCQLPATYSGASVWHQGHPELASLVRPINFHDPIAVGEPASEHVDHVSIHEEVSATARCPQSEILESLPVPVQGVSRIDENNVTARVSKRSLRELKEAGSIMTSTHKRRYSEAAIQLIEGRLTDPIYGNTCHRKRRSMYVRLSEDREMAGH